MGSLWIFLMNILAARALGISEDRDAWVIASAALAVVMTGLWRPVIHGLREESDRGRAEAAGLLGWFGLMLLLFILFAPGAISQFLAPGSSPELHLLLGKILEVLGLVALFQGLSELWSRKPAPEGSVSWLLPSWGSSVLLVQLGVVAFFATRMGVRAWVLGGLAGACLVALRAAKDHLRSQWKTPLWLWPSSRIRARVLEETGRWGILSFWISAAWLSRPVLATRLGAGAASAVDYSFALLGLPAAAGAAWLESQTWGPEWSASAVRSARAEFRNRVKDLATKAWLAAVSLGAVLVFASNELVRGVYRAGGFTEVEVRLCARVVRALGFGVPGAALFWIAFEMLHRSGRPERAWRFLGIALSVAAVLNWLYSRGLGVSAFGWTWAVGFWFSALFLVASLVGPTGMARLVLLRWLPIQAVAWSAASLADRLLTSPKIPSLFLILGIAGMAAFGGFLGLFLIRRLKFSDLQED